MTDILERLIFREFDGTATLAELAAIDEIERLRASVAHYKRVLLSYDAIVTVGGKDMIVPSDVKVEIERLRSAIAELNRLATIANAALTHEPIPETQD